VHQIDLARWALGVEEPLEVTGMGRKLYFDDDQKTPDTVNVTFEYKNKALMFEMRIWNPYGMEGQQNGVAIYGSEGVMHIGRWVSETGRRQHGYRIYDRQHKLAVEDYDYEDHNWHARNFVDCIRSRKAPNAEIAIGHTSTLHAHLANIVVRTGQPLKFDANLETVFGSASAQKFLGREYRKHWATPKQT
jgi:predicted dehydrogenase